MATKKKKIKSDWLTFRVEPDIKKGLETLAKQDRRTLVSYIDKLLANHVYEWTSQRDRIDP